MGESTLHLDVVAQHRNGAACDVLSYSFVFEHAPRFAGVPADQGVSGEEGVSGDEGRASSDLGECTPSRDKKPTGPVKILRTTTVRRGNVKREKRDSSHKSNVCQRRSIAVLFARPLPRTRNAGCFSAMPACRARGQRGSPPAGGSRSTQKGGRSAAAASRQWAPRRASTGALAARACSTSGV